MKFYDNWCSGCNDTPTSDSDKVNYMNAAITVVDSMNLNILKASSKAATVPPLFVVKQYIETAASGHHEVTYNEKVQLKQYQWRQQQQQVIVSEKPIGSRQLNYRNNSNNNINNKSFPTTNSKTFVAKQQRQQQRPLSTAGYLVLLFIIMQFTAHSTCCCFTTFKISPREWLENCDRTGQVAFVDQQECSRTLQRQLSDRADIGDIEWLLMILQCDVQPMIKKFESFLPLYRGVKELTIPEELNSANIGLQLNSKNLEIWRELLAIESLINYFYSEAMQVLSRSDFCTYPTISKLGQLKNIVLGSKTLGYAYDLIAIKLHTNCLIKTLNKLPQVPYLVKDVVDTYMNGVNNTVKMTKKANKPFGDDELGEEYVFDADEAIAKNGPLSFVVQLSLSSFGSNHNEKHFIQECKNFLIDFEERWQAMEMMSMMLSTDFNGIQRFNNYVIRLLVSTKYADYCSRLSNPQFLRSQLPVGP